MYYAVKKYYVLWPVFFISKSHYILRHGHKTKNPEVQ